MGENTRVYIYGVSKGGLEEFLHTTLDMSGAVSYIKSHAKTFPKRFEGYRYGYQSQSKEEWKSHDTF